MNRLLRYAMLTLIWAALTGNFAPNNLLFGFGLSVLILMFTQRILGRSTYTVRLMQVPVLLLFFIRELIISNLRVAYYVLAPGYRMRPAIVAVPLDVQSDTEITLLANLISLTPGTLSLDVSSDRHTLYIHAMSVRSGDHVRRAIKSGFERRIKAVFVTPPRDADDTRDV